MVIQQYQDPQVGKWLKLGYWYAEHKTIIIKIIIGLLIAINIGFWGNTFFNIYKITQSNQYQEQMFLDLVENRIPVEQLHQEIKPEEIEISQITIVPNAAAKTSIIKSADIVDAIAYAENLNDDWIAEIEYTFSANNSKTISRTAQLLPKEQTALIGLGLSGPIIQSQADIDFKVSWTRAKQKDKKLIERAQYAKSSLKATVASIQPLNGYTDVRVAIENQGAYDLASSDVIIILKRMDSAYAVSMYQTSGISAENDLEINMRYHHSLPSGMEAQVFPLLDFLDDSIYSVPSKGLDFRL